MVNGEIWDNLLDRSIEIHNVVKYNGVPCLPAKCPTNEICVPQFKDYACKCNSKYFDKKCEDQ